MPGGSLRSFLLNHEKRPPWRWHAESAVAIARGGDSSTSTRVAALQSSIATSSPITDGHGVARITDFGISKLLGTQQVHTTVTHARGTRAFGHQGRRLQLRRCAAGGARSQWWLIRRMAWRRTTRRSPCSVRRRSWWARGGQSGCCTASTLLWSSAPLISQLK